MFKIFVAGSKELTEERKVCRSVCNSLQNQWKDTIITKTYEDFPDTLSKKGHQKEYNQFISEQADLVVFIFSKQVGNITKLEFEHAWNSYKKKDYPKILVYFDKSEGSITEEVQQFKDLLSDRGQYYKEYATLNELGEMTEKHINKVVIEHRNKHPKQYSSCLGRMSALLLVWLLLALVGGIGMYIYDRNMDEEDCYNLAVKYVESGRGSQYMYYFPDETFVYDKDLKTLDIVPREHSSSSADITLSKVEHVAFGTTATLLLSRIAGFKAEGNGKTIAAYVAGVAMVIIGCGVGCVVEQMIFPPQYSEPVREYLSNKANWERVIIRSRPSRWF